MSDQLNQESTLHDLRDRTGINPPSRYAQYHLNCSSPNTLRRKRGGKKGSITKRIKQIDEIIAKGGSRSKLMVLIEQLKVTLDDATSLHEGLMKTIDKNDVEYSNDYIEELSIEVDTCASNVLEYLEERAGDPPSKAPSYLSSKSSHTDNSDERTRRWCEEQGILGAEARDGFPGIVPFNREVSNIAPPLEVCSGFRSQAYNPFHFGAPTLNSVFDIEEKVISGEVPFLPEFKNLLNENELVSSASTEYCELPLGNTLLNVNPFEDSPLFLSSADTMVTYTLQEAGIPVANLPLTSVCHPTSKEVPVEQSILTAVREDGFPGIITPPHSRHVTFGTTVSSGVPISLSAVAPSAPNAYSKLVSTECFNAPAEPSFSNMHAFNKTCSRPSSTMPTCTSETIQYSNMAMPTYHCTLGIPSLANQLKSGSCSTYTTVKYPQHLYGQNNRVNLQHVPIPNDGTLPHYSTVRRTRNPQTQCHYIPQGVGTPTSSVDPLMVSSGSSGLYIPKYSAGISSPTPIVSSQYPALNQYPHRCYAANIPSNQIKNVPPSGSVSIDKWIDELPQREAEYISQIEDTVNATSMMQRWMVNQNLPMMEIPKFDGSPLQWIDFITHFREVVHLQPYLTTARRLAYLTQHLEKEAKRAVSGFKGDWLGYVSALKRLKFMFGQRASVAHAHISKITKGKHIKDYDMAALTEMFYDISDCLSNLQRLEYYSDLGSTDVLRQAIARLPPRLKAKWCERSYSIRRVQEPNLHHLAEWLGNRIMAARDPYMPQDGSKAGAPLGLFMTGVDGVTSKPGATRGPKVCPLCKENGHLVPKCKQYTEKDTAGRFGIAQSKRLCYNCLRDNHNTKNCKSKFNCFVPGCDKSHHTSLHDHFQSKTVNSSTPATSTTTVTSCKVHVEEEETMLEKGDGNVVVEDDDNSAISEQGTVNVAHTDALQKSKRVYFKTVPVRVSSERGVVFETHAFLDDGSEGTFIREDLAKLLQIKGRNVDITIGTIVDAEAEKINTKRAAFTISGVHTNAKGFLINDALVLPTDRFHTKAQQLPSDFHTNRVYKHLQGFGFKDIEKEKIQLLIGTDHYETSLITEMRKGGDGRRPVAVKTPLGWTLFGRDEVSRQGENVEISARVNFVKAEELSELSKTVHEFWTTESFGTQFKGKKSYSIQDKRVEHAWDLSTGYKNGHYIVSMPWTDHSTNLPDSRFVAEKRLKGLLIRFKRNPELYKMYAGNIKEYVEKGYARKMTQVEVNTLSKKTWYLPHHAVTNVNKPNKVRTVFDAAAKAKNTSLNDQLHTGPDLVNNLTGILLRFRNHHVALTADIQAMFHQVYVSDDDRDALRFFWKDDLDDKTPVEVYQMLVHIFGAKSSPSCTAYALRRAALDSTDEYPMKSIDAILNDFYVDDFLRSSPSVQEAVATALDVTKILQGHGFNLTKFMSNSREVLAAIPEVKLAHQKEFFDVEYELVERTLGVRWNVKKDIFTFSVDNKEHPVTKRGILQTVSSVFDPLGFLGPFTIRAKILLQSLWRRKYDWDDPIANDERELWVKWCSEIPLLPSFEIPRCYLHPAKKILKSMELHIFADASELAFGAVGYMRTIYCDGSIGCCMLFSKSRLAPIKTLTIPRLELQAAVLAVRVKNTIIEEIHVQVDAIYFWSDSTITLQYICNDSKRYKTFVANRVAEIREHSYPNQWNHIKGEDNPADSLTRGLSISQISRTSRWVQGPAFLRQIEEDWPFQAGFEDLNSDDTEIRTIVSMSCNTKPIELFEDYSSWWRMLNIVGWLLRFANRCRKKVTNVSKYLTLKELHESRNVVLRMIQRKHYKDEYRLLVDGECLPSNSPLLSLRPHVNNSDGLMRVGGRVQRARIPYAAKHQIILPSKNTLVNKLVNYEHRMNIDCGPNQLLSHLQGNYWILGGKKLIKKVQRNCLECKKRTVKPQVPLMADLPGFRVDLQTPAFYNTGVDFFGPINTKLGRRTQKRWGALFTCLVTRAIHLEVAEGLSTDAFINVLERFINRRGNPKQIVSDCGSNFKGADKELVSCLKELEHEKIAGFAARKSINWIFNPPEAPHMGGVWERLVRSVKIPLRTILKDRTLTDLQLATVFTEVESLVNSRPLTVVSENPDDLEALTPNHFLLGRGNPNLPFNVVYDTDKCSRKKWKEVQFLTQHFWKRWIKEYLPQLTIRQRWRTESRNMKKGDIVLLVDNNASRGMWRLGRVLDVHPGKDDRVRVVQVKTKDGVYTRPVSKLCLLEGSEDQTTIDC